MDRYSEILRQLEAENRLRCLPRHRDGLLDLSSNDYLGLAIENDKYWEEFRDTLPGAPLMTSSASRLLANAQESYYQLETLLGELYNREALLFNSGYHANTGCISALAVPGTIIVADKLAHASMIDGMVLSRQPFYRFKHNDVESASRIIEAHAADCQQVLLVTESVFSMDGDTAPLHELVELKRRHPHVMLYLDEAHAFGVRGAKGLGLAEELGLMHDIDILVGTFGKAAASSGAFAVCSPEVKQFLINAARSLIFSTALPPVCADWTRFMIGKFLPMRERRARLAEISRQLVQGIEAITGQENPSRSQIVPLVMGDARRVMEMSEALAAHGYLALPIRKPTVPAGTERIRFSLNAGLGPDDINNLLQTIADLRI